MSDVAAPPTLLLRRRSTLETLRLDASLEIGAGGEARIFALPRDPRLVAKIYHEPSVERARKVALMIEEPPRIDDPRATLAWPVDLLLGEGGRFAGFLMPRAEGPRLFELYNPITRRRTGALCDHAMLHRAGAHVAAAFDALHARGYVVGDVNESNVLLRPDGGVTLVDTDSFQVRDPDDGTVHRSKVGKAEFTPPELQGRSFADFDRTPEHDLFGLAVLLFLALMEGTHPFAGRTDAKAETPPVEERIRRGLFAHQGHPEIQPPKLAPPFAVLDPGLQALFVRCFAGGHAEPSARPSAAEWRTALAAAETRMKTCGANPRHRFGPHLGACPWCERTALLHGRDPFPATPAAPARRPAPPRRITAPPHPVAAKPVPAPTPSPAPVSPIISAAPPQPADSAWETLKTVGYIGTVVAYVALSFGVSAVAAMLLGVLAAVVAAMMRSSDASTPAPQAALPSPAPAFAPALPPVPVLPTWPHHRLRIGPPSVQGMDAALVLLNRAELEDAMAGVQPPAGVGPKDWTIRIVAWVREDGAVEPNSVRVVRPAQHGDAFAAAVSAVSRAQLEPLLRRRRPVGAWVSFGITFEKS